MPSFAEIGFPLASYATLPGLSATFGSLSGSLFGGVLSGWGANPNPGAAPGKSVTDWTSPPMTVQPVSGGAPWAFAEVLEVTRSLGVTPGKAVISIRNIAAQDETGPIVMGKNAFAENVVKYWSRVNVFHNNQTLFTGALMKRLEPISANSIVLEYWDDRWLLSKLRLRGCVCLDPYDNTLKLIPRLDPHCNPKGYLNCTRVPNTKDAYAFIAPAEWGTQTLEYDAGMGQGDDGAAGTAIAWTPERFLKYLRHVATVFDATAGGTNSHAKTWAMLDTSKLQWNAPTFQDGTMRAKMPDKNFKGLSYLQAIQETLDISGEYDLGVDYSGNYLRFSITTQGAQNQNDPSATKGKTIFLQRSGAIADNKGVCDGQAECDASEFASAQLSDGAPYRIESELKYSNTKTTHDAFGLAWSTTEQANFFKIISTGKDLNGTDIPGGSGGSLKNTSFALRVARTCFPKVFRALQLDPSVSDGVTILMAGLNNVLAQYPYLSNYRVCMPEQLQPYFDDPTQPTKRGRLRVPIRIQVSDVDVTQANPKFHDVNFNNGLRVTNDGLIWLDGLTDDIGDPLDWIYSKPLTTYDGTDATLPKMRYIKINMAVEHDARIWAQYDLFFDGVDWNGIGDIIDGSLKGSTTGPRTQNYSLNPEGYLYESQVNSSPVLPGSFQTTDGNSPPKLVSIATPCNKVLYTNQGNLTDSAGRSHQRVCNVKRNCTFDLPGIRPDMDAGDFIEKVSFIGVASGEEYKVNKPWRRVHFDARTQRTKVTAQ